MGLKTENYTLEKTGQVLPTAYAKIRTLVLNDDNSIRVKFGIHYTREDLDKHEPIAVVELDSRSVGYAINRNNPWQEEAYNMARTHRNVTETWDKKTKSVITTEEYGPLFGWQNDIVGGEEQ